MSGNAPPANPTSAHVQALLPKFNNPDPDIRYMSLNDLHQILQAGHPTFLAHDLTTCAKVVEGFLNTLNDQNGDVQNMSIRCLGPFVNRAPDSLLCPMIEKISNIKTDNSVDNSIPALAVRAVVVALPRPVPGSERSPKVLQAYNAISKAVIPRLVGHMVVPISSKTAPAPPKGMLEIEMETGQDTNSLDILTEVARCFGSMLQEVEVKALQKVTIEILENGKCSSVMKKKAVAALSMLSTYFSDAHLSSFVSYTIEVLRQPSLIPSQKKLYLSIYSAMAKAIPRKFGPYLQTLTPFVLSPVSQQELDDQRDAAAESDDEGGHDPQAEEVRETALVALDAFCAYCPQDMTLYATETIDSGLRFLKYDPNYADDDEDMDESDGEDQEMDLDEDFEEETGYDDEDDVSWKVRRCSAKMLHTLAGSRLLANDDVLYAKLAPALISRFSEREESVRLEVLSTMASFISKAREPYRLSSEEFDTGVTKSMPQGRKRRRGSSSAGFSQVQIHLASSNGYTSPSTPPPQSASQQNLTTIGPDITKAAAKLLKSSTTPTKQACISLLTTLAIAQRGGLSKSLDLIMSPVLDLLKTSSSGSGSSVAQLHALRIEVLRLLRAIADLHSSKVLQPHLERVVPILISAAEDKYGKVAVEAIETIEVFIKALTPPRSVAAQSQTSTYLKQLYVVITSRISSTDTDTEVRQRAICALGLLVGRTSGSRGTTMLSPNDRLAGHDLVLDRLKNELTRLASVRAVETIALLTQSNKEYRAGWVQQVSLELGAQLRKANRSLRGSSLSALRILAINQSCRQAYDDQTVERLVSLFLPVLSDTDLLMLGPALTTLSAYAKDKPDTVLTHDVITSLCRLLKLDLQGSTLDSLLEFVETFGRSGRGEQLMKALLKEVGIGGNSEIVGQVIGTLLVSADGSVGVTLDDFKTELASSEDERRKCLALYILGEAGLRLGSKSPLGPTDFTKNFEATGEKVQIAAAVALGRAGAGNVKAYLPTILSSMKSGGNYLLLHTVKEMLQHSTAEGEILEYSKDLWEMILTAAKEEDNKTLGAECIGRLAIIDPAAYLPQLLTYLEDPEPAIRGMVIAAFRYTFTDTDTSYDMHLQPLIVQSLTKMLNEDNLENRRLALTTFNSAAHNKPQLITPHLSELLPMTMNETIIRDELIRVVAMGPFKHRVDDGLEIRKSAYETLYALMDTAFSSLPVGEFMDRVIAGIGDEHEIKILCCLILTKLITVAPTETSRTLEKFAEAFRVVLSFKPKDNAVKQELEKLQEHNKAILKVVAQMNKAFPIEAAECRQWLEVVEFAKKEHPVASRLADEELREKDR